MISRDSVSTSLVAASREMIRSAAEVLAPSPKFNGCLFSMIPPTGVFWGMWPWLSVQSTKPLISTVFGLPETGSQDIVP